MSTNDNIRLRIQQALQTSVAPQVKVKKSSAFLTSFLGVCIVCLSFVTAFAVWKKPIDSEMDVPPPTKNPIAALPEMLDLKHLSEQIAHRSKETEGMAVLSAAEKARLDRLEKEMEVWTLRCWMLGVLQNENTYLTQKAIGKKPGYLYFDHEWKLNRMPNAKFNERERAKMEQQVKRASK